MSLDMAHAWTPVMTKDLIPHHSVGTLSSNIDPATGAPDTRVESVDFLKLSRALTVATNDSEIHCRSGDTGLLLSRGQKNRQQRTGRRGFALIRCTERGTENKGKNDEKKGNDDYDIASPGSHDVSLFLVSKIECVNSKRSIIWVLYGYAKGESHHSRHVTHTLDTCILY